MYGRLALLMVLLTPVAMGCTCTIPSTSEVKWIAHDSERYPLIFEALVSREERRSRFGDAPFQALLNLIKTGKMQIAPYTQYTMNVVQRYKGEIPRTIIVRSTLTEGSCSCRFAVGRRYLIYGWPKGSELVDTDICTRTAPVEDRAVDIAFLKNRASSSSAGK